MNMMDVNIIFSFLGDQEIIIPEWLFELPIIEPEKNEISKIICDSENEIILCKQ